MTERDALERVLPLTPAVFHVLVALAEGPHHGYAIAREVDDLSDGRVVMGPGTLYGSLQRMQESGLIEETENPGEGAPGRYSPTSLRGTSCRCRSPPTGAVSGSWACW